MRQDNFKLYLTYWSDCSTVEVRWFRHDSRHLGPPESLQVQLPQVRQDHLSIIAPTYKHLWWERQNRVCFKHTAQTGVSEWYRANSCSPSLTCTQLWHRRAAGYPVKNHVHQIFTDASTKTVAIPTNKPIFGWGLVRISSQKLVSRLYAWI